MLDEGEVYPTKGQEGTAVITGAHCSSGEKGEEEMVARKEAGPGLAQEKGPEESYSRG